MARIASAVFLVLIIGLLPSIAKAGDAFTGFQIDNKSQYFSYLGLRAPLPFKTSKIEPFAQVFAAGLGYRFRVNGQLRDAEAQTINPALGVKTTLGSTTFIGLVGPQFRRKEEDIAGGGRQVDYEVGVNLQVEAGRWEQQYSWHAIASYADLDNFFWGRLRGTRLVYSPPATCCPTSLGWDIAGMGNDEFHGVQTGPLVQVDFGGVYGLVKGGYQYTSTFRSGGYTGLEIYIPF